MLDPTVATAETKSKIQTQPAPTRLDGFIDFNGYYDDRKFSTLTVNTLLNLPHRLQYFSFVNYENALQAEHPSDLSLYLTEQNLRWAPSATLPFDLVTQWMHSSGDENDILRLGIRWRPDDTRGLKTIFKKINTTYSVSFYGLQADFIPGGGYRAQFEHFYRIDFLPKWFHHRVYLSGFLDHNILFEQGDGTMVSTFISEHQIGIRCIDNLYAVAEYRHNGFLAEQKNGIGFGLEYFVPFEVIVQ